MNRKNIIRMALYAVAIAASMSVFLLFITGTWIGYEVKEQCRLAAQVYPENRGDCVEHLSWVVDNDTHSYRQRNSAVWALGQLGDERAVPILEQHFTGEIPEREPLDSTLSQYELQKALRLARGGKNIAAWIWR